MEPKGSNEKYLNKFADRMPICGPLLKYGHFNFNFDFYILEEHNKKWDTNALALREEFWVKKVNPSYNLAAIFDTFIGSNHPRFNKPVSDETRKKISNSLKKTLTNYSRSSEEIENRRKGAPKKAVYCFNTETLVLEATFTGQRPMARELNIDRNLVQTKVDTKKPLICEYNGIKRSWFLTSMPIFS